MEKTQFVLLAAAFAIGGYSKTPLAHQQNQHQHGAHVHGQVQMSVAALENELLIEWHIPAGDIFGFEHGPGSSAQTAIIEEELGWLQTAAWVYFEGLHGCELIQARVQTDLLNETHTGHADVNVSMHWRCVRNVNLNSLEIRLFERYEQLQSIHYDWLNESQAGSNVLTRPQQQLDL